MRHITRMAGAAALALLFAAAAYAQATTRSVVGTIKKPDGSAWSGASIKFALDKSTYSSTTIFPAAVVTATTNASGKLCVVPCSVEGVTLWANAEGTVKTLYTVTLPDASTFQFRLSLGDGSAVDITTLRAAGVTPLTSADPAYVTLQAFVATHAAAADPHAVYLTEAEGDARYAPLDGGGGGVTDHGALTGLADDDHTQYFNQARGDARYYTQAQLDAFLAARAAVSHGHVVADVSGLQTQLDAKLDAASNLSELASAATARTNLGLGTAATKDVAASGDASTAQVVKGDDTRLTDSRAPTGGAGGVLSGSYPSPGFAVDMAVQSELDSETSARIAGDLASQPVDSDLTAIAALTPSNDDLLQRKAGAWTSRSPAQLKTDLALTKADVGLASVDNTADSAKPVSTAQQAALDLKANLVSPSFTTPSLGVASATSINKVAITAPATSATLTIANGKTLTVNNSVTFSGTDGTTHTLPSTTSTVARTDTGQAFTGDHSFSGSVAIGTTPATTGAVRLANNVYVYGRRSDNSNNHQLLGLDSSNQVVLSNGSNNISLAGLWLVDVGTGAIRNAGGYPLGWSNQSAYVSSAASGIVEVNNGTNGTYRDFKVRQHYVDATMTAAGTTGAQTINKAAGSVNFAAGASSLVVTNSLVTTTSIVLATIQTDDATATSVKVIPAAGSFTLKLNAAATAETKVAFLVVNK